MLQELTGEPLQPPSTDNNAQTLATFPELADPLDSSTDARASSPLDGKLLPVILGAAAALALCVMGAILLLLLLKRRKRRNVHSEEGSKHGAYEGATAVYSTGLQSLNRSPPESTRDGSIQEFARIRHVHVHGDADEAVPMHAPQSQTDGAGYASAHGLQVHSGQGYDSTYGMQAASLPHAQAQSLRAETDPRCLAHNGRGGGQVCMLLSAVWFLWCLGCESFDPKLRMISSCLPAANCMHIH